MNRLVTLFPLFKIYKWNLVSNALLNALGAILSLFSFLSVVPFLRILFAGKATKVETEFIPAANDIPGMIGAWFDNFVIEVGTAQALLTVCITVIILAILKNGVSYINSRTRVLRLLKDFL